jgi:hypothetical protein
MGLRRFRLRGVISSPLPFLVQIKKRRRFLCRLIKRLVFLKSLYLLFQDAHGIECLGANAFWLC